jgi:flagellar protein FlbD
MTLVSSGYLSYPTVEEPAPNSFPQMADKSLWGVSMIRLTRLNHVPMVLNSDLIEHIEVTPDTVITLTTGQILRVRESADEVVERIVDYRRRIYGPEGRPALPRQQPNVAEPDETVNQQ